MIFSVGEATDELKARGYYGVDTDRLTNFLAAGVRRALAPSTTWPFLAASEYGFVPGNGADFTASTATLPMLAAVSTVLDPETGRVIPHRRRAWLISAGYNVGLVGTREYFYVGRSPSGVTIFTYPVDPAPVNLEYFRNAELLLADDYSLWNVLPTEFWDVILDCAELAAAKDAKDWETVQGLAPEIALQQGVLLERYFDEQVANDELIVASQFD